VPTLVLTATSDPITPPALAEAIAARHPEARLVETKGGAHGSLGDGCADDRLADFILDGRLPIGPRSACSGDVTYPFLPLASSPASNGGDAGLGLYWELFATPEVLMWDGQRPLDVGCGDEGWARLSAMDDQGHAEVTFRGCQWATNGRFDGTGWLDPTTGAADLSLTNSNGGLHVVADGRGAHVTGTWRGSEVDARW
jgi:hypothetical protein